MFHSAFSTRASGILDTDLIKFSDMENSDIVGCSCSLLMPISGYGEGVVVEDYGTEVLVRLTNGKEVVEYRDDIMLID